MAEVRAERRPVTAIETELAWLTRALDGLSRRSGIYAQLDRASYLVSRTLDGRPPTTINALAAMLGLDATTVTRQVAAMDDEGLVRRTRDPRDGRACLVELTSAGRRRMDEVRRARTERLAELLDEWTTDEQREFARGLGRFNTSIRSDRESDERDVDD